jgi:DNA topoisomerase-3
MTAFNSKEGGFYLTTVGRVQTPTLAILVEREDKIRAFTSRAYWEVHARFEAKAGEYPGRWFDPEFKKNDEDAERKAERLWDAAAATKIVAACRGKKGIASEESKPATQISPLLFDLTSLQREANGRFGFPARMTLSLAQSLYEKHKVLTYPRTDSRALPEDYLPTVKDTLKELADTDAFGSFAKQVLKQGWVKPNKRIFDNAKISDHFAIIPTLQTPKHLSEAEHKLYDMVVRRFLAVFFPAAEFLQTTRITKVGEHHFKTEGRVLQSAGWLAIYGRATGDEEKTLPAIEAKEQVPVLEVTEQANETKPPPRYSEATLLSAMEGAGKLIEDDELREAMEAKGLGTPATRAATIEGLIREEYIHREGRELVPTPKAFSLIFALDMLHIVELASPELTGEWEHKLRLIEQGKLTRDVFMKEISELVGKVVGLIKTGEIPDVVYATVSAPCPKCGKGVVQENYRKFQCQTCDFNIWKVTSGREWSTEEVATLITKRVIGPLTGFRSRIGRPFAAVMRLTDDFRAEFDFGQDKDGNEAAPDFSGQEPLGPCPKCGNRVFEHGMAYTCEKAVGPAKTCDFRSGRMILQQPIEREQMKKLLATGKTDLLTAFVSKKGRRFKAFLVKQPDGKIGFEFQARAPKKGEKPQAPEEKATRRGSGRRARSTR